MNRHRVRPEKHFIDRVGWLRAAVLGANDGIISTASLIVGVARSGREPACRVDRGRAGLVAGAMSMAAGGYARSVRNPTRTGGFRTRTQGAERKPGI